MADIEVSAYPYATIFGNIEVPDNIPDKEMTSYISEHWDDIKWGNPDLDFCGTDFEWYREDGDRLMTGYEAIKRMCEPRQYMKGCIFDCQIDFFNPTNPQGFEDDEVSFTIDCTEKYKWREELFNLWEDFRKENHLPERIVTDAWSTLPEDEDLEAFGYDPTTYWGQYEQ